MYNLVSVYDSSWLGGFMYSLVTIHDLWCLCIQSGYITCRLVALCIFWLQYMSVGGSMYSLVTIHNGWWLYVQSRYRI